MLERADTHFDWLLAGVLACLIFGLGIAVLPFALLVLCLAAGCYPGERALQAARNGRRRPRRPSSQPRIAPLVPDTFAAGGALLLSLSMGRRGPPRPAR